ncbi:hypothetical protein AAVH_29501 [Aphelenchoides avenae]|nr:hypothetical protein AAVH_29501 [Aphelenchus avenae]
MLLPNESHLEALYFADFSTLVSAKFVDARFLRVVTVNGQLLAIQRRFNVLVFNSYISYDTNGSRRTSIRYERADLQSFAAACRALADVIGQHVVGKLTLFDNTSIIPGVEMLFELVPALKFAHDVIVNFQGGSQAAGDPEAFMRNFARLKSLGLSLDHGIFRQFTWSFLGLDAARELQLVKFFGPSFPTEDVNRSVEELVRYCATCPRLLGGGTLEIDFPKSEFSTGLILDENEYAIDADDTTTRYTSANSGIVVEFKGLHMSIQSGAEVPPTKRRRRNE